MMNKFKLSKFWESIFLCFSHDLYVLKNSKSLSNRNFSIKNEPIISLPSFFRKKTYNISNPQKFFDLWDKNKRFGTVADGFNVFDGKNPQPIVKLKDEYHNLKAYHSLASVKDIEFVIYVQFWDSYEFKNSDPDSLGVMQKAYISYRSFMIATKHFTLSYVSNSKGMTKTVYRPRFFHWRRADEEVTKLILMA